MNASQYAGTVIIPTLSRLVLCAAFFTAGWAKVFTDTSFTAQEAHTLKEMGVQVKQSVAWHDEPFASPGVIAASWVRELPHIEPVQDEPAVGRLGQPAPTTSESERAADTANQDTPVDESVPPQTPPTEPDTKPEETTESPLSEQSLPEGDHSPADVFQARSLLKIAVALDGAGWQYPYYLAWAAALTELFGGALLLIGLFSRVWGLGLAITMALAFHITSMDPYLAAPFAAAEGRDGFALFHQVFAQLGLFILAFGIFVTGPGPLSLDRAIFRRSGPSEVEIDLNDGP